MSNAERWKAQLRKRLLPILNPIQRLSAPPLVVFLIVHLSAPTSALVGGSSQSSQMMLLGREYYRASPTHEILLVWLPIGLHIASSFFKSILRPSANRPKPSLLTIAAYPLTLLLPIHILVHRIYPSNPVLPASALEVDYEYVKVGLARWPMTSWLLLGTLAFGGVVHTCEGLIFLWRVWGPKGGSRRETQVSSGSNWKQRKDLGLMGWRVTAAGLTIAVLGGIAIVAAEPSYASRSLTARIHASYLRSAVFRFLS